MPAVPHSVSWDAMRVYATILCLLLFSGPCWSAEPTLARLSFWVLPERMDEFATAYQEKLLPILKGHGLVESAQLSRTTESVLRAV